MAKSKRYPRTLYKRSNTGKMLFANKNHRIRYDTVIVEDDNEQQAAEDMGYIDGFSDALFHVNKNEEQEDALPEEF